jgi:sugar phosphate isomerase/epimerase
MVPEPPFSLGATSYVVDSGLCDNASFLAGKVDDMELVLFDLPDGTSNLPSPAERCALAEIGKAYHLTYSVHLPLDLSLQPNRHSLTMAARVLESVEGLPISAVIAHVDDWVWRRQRRYGWDPFLLAQWESQALEALETVQHMLPDSVPLCVENLESYPPESIASLAKTAVLPLCIDVGHLWKYRHPRPMNFLQQHLPQAQVIHLHACLHGTDHQTLFQIPQAAMDSLMTLLQETGFHGILTMEVFGNQDFTSSLAALRSSLERTSTAWQS